MFEKVRGSDARFQDIMSNLYVNFKTEMQGRIDIEIIDQMGRRVEKFASNQKIIQYNCSQLTSGKYLVKISSGSRVKVGMMTIIK